MKAKRDDTELLQVYQSSVEDSVRTNEKNSHLMKLSIGLSPNGFESVGDSI